MATMEPGQLAGHLQSLTDRAHDTSFTEFLHALIASLSVIIVSELGDKTFFIAAIMAMKHSRSLVFVAAISALILMTLLSVLLGLVTTIIPRSVTHFASIALFVLFGLKMLWEGYKMSEEESKEEFEEVQQELSSMENRSEGVEYSLNGGITEDPETGVIKSISSVPWSTRIRRKFMICFSLVFIQVFSLTFVAEWGDRSQISTIILAARENPVGVSLGAIVGHSICSGIAVIGGRIVAQMISVRTVTLIGGVIFILFAISAAIMGEG